MDTNGAYAAIRSRILAPIVDEAKRALDLPPAPDRAGGLPEMLADGLATMAGTIAAEIAAMTARLAAIEDRLAAIEERGFNYRGTWKSGQQYDAGTWITFDGSLWIANEATSAKPGDGPTPWHLAVKRGKNGKDGRGARDGVP